MTMINVSDFSPSYKPLMLEAQKITQWPVARSRAALAGAQVTHVEAGYWAKAQPYRSYSRYARTSRPRIPSVVTRTQQYVAERIFVQYGSVIYLRDLVSPGTIKDWLRRNSATALPNRDDRYAVIAGVFIEGINFNTADPEVVARAQSIFHDLSSTVVRMFEEEPPPPSRASAYPQSKLKAYGERRSDSTSYSILHSDGNGTPFVNGYVRVGNIIVTNLPNMAALAAVLTKKEHYDKQGGRSEGDQEASFRAAWLERLLDAARQRELAATEKVERLSAALREASRELGEARMMLRVSSLNTDAVLDESIKRLRSLPETEKVTLSDTQITIITGPMLAVLARTGAERYCGKFEIQIDLRGAVRVRNIASPASGYRNPHGWCVGSFGGVFANALAAFDYYALILAIMEYYRTFDANHEDAWGTLPNSRSTPKKVFVSDWHTLVGKWGVPTKKTPDNVTKVGEVIRTYGFAPSQQPDAPDAPESDGTTDGAYDSNVAVLRPTAARKR